MSALKAAIIGGAAAVGLALALHTCGVVTTAATAPGRVINKTLGTDNIITSYEWFYDANAQYESRVNQLKWHTTLVQTEENPGERSRLNIELAAIKQSCRDLVTRYNANSAKANKQIFKSRGLPESLSLSTCEG